MLALPLHYALLALCAGYALLQGGVPERAGAAILAAGSAMGLLVMSAPMTTGGVFVDCALTAALVLLALRSDRYWPMWVAALQLVATAAHFARLADLGVSRPSDSSGAAFWAYPMLLLLAVATYRRRGERPSGR